jgi:ABC-2 type transport system ATP-binding protein
MHQSKEENPAMDMDKFAIQTRNLTKKFGKRTAVDDLNIEIRRGEIFSLLGKNGAGKTTTIKMLCCLLQPSFGNASLLGFNITQNPYKIKQLIGVSPQETAIAEHLTTRENLLLMGGVSGLSPAESKSRAKNLMELMELENRKDQSRKLSGGLQRRLSIAMALMSDPQLLFLDEPTLGLDPHARKSVWNYIEKLKGEKTILLTTHYLEEADALSDHIAIIDQGKIIEKGTTHELKKRGKKEQTLQITAENIAADTIESLKKQDLEVNRTSYGIEIKAKTLDFYSIMEVFRLKNISIQGIQMHEPTLEDIFIQLTGKENDQ